MAFDIKTALLGITCFAAGSITQLIWGASNQIASMRETTADKRYTEVTPTFQKYANETRGKEMVPSAINQTGQRLSITPPMQQPSSTSLIEEIIPPSLHSKYTPDNLEFNITRSMLKRSRPIIGNTERLHAFIHKLQTHQCTVVLFLGGSVTDGHHVKGRSAEAYPAHFMLWLNAQYPCLNQDGSAGQHEM